MYDKQGKQESKQYKTITHAENNAFEYRYGLESKNSKMVKIR